MNYLSLQYFCKIAQHGNMTRAAEALHVSQPALSKTLNQLESELSQKLFHRTASGLTLTEAGLVFYEKVSAGLSLINEGIDAVKQSASVQTHILKLTSCLNADFLSSMYLAFQQENPDIHLELEYLPINALQQSDGFDFLLCPSTLTPLPAHSVELFQEDLFLLVPSTHPLAKKESIHFIEAAPYPFVIMGKSAPIYHYFQTLCQAAHFTPQIACECDTRATLYKFMESGTGITLIPACSANFNTKKFRAIPIVSPKCYRSVLLCWSDSNILSGAKKQFHDFCIQYFQTQFNAAASFS